MSNRDYLRIVYCDLTASLKCNFNDNFNSVSFEIYDDSFVQTRFILNVRTTIEEDLIADCMVEFDAMHLVDGVLVPEIYVLGKAEPFNHIVLRNGNLIYTIEEMIDSNWQPLI